MLKSTLKCLQSIRMRRWTKGGPCYKYCMGSLKLLVLAINWKLLDFIKLSLFATVHTFNYGFHGICAKCSISKQHWWKVDGNKNLLITKLSPRDYKTNQTHPYTYHPTNNIDVYTYICVCLFYTKSLRIIKIIPFYVCINGRVEISSSDSHCNVKSMNSWTTHTWKKENK